MAIDLKNIRCGCPAFLCLYQYFYVPAYVYEELMNSDSKDSYIHRNVKNSFNCERI